MWEEPSIFLTRFISYFWKAAQETKMWEHQLQAYEDLSPQDVIQEVKRLYDDVCELLQKSLPSGRLNSKTRSAIRNRLIKMARQIEDSGEYLRLSLWLSIAYEAKLLQPQAEPFEALVEAIKILVGTESQYLIGICGERPAWKQFSRPVSRDLMDFLELARYGDAKRLEVVDQSDAAIFPDLGEYIMNVAEYDWPEANRARMLYLMEDAYYRQRYIVHPEGAYVRLQHLGPLKGMTLKVKKGIVDPGFVDILAVVEVDAKALDPSDYKSDPDDFLREALIVVDGAYLTGQWDFLDKQPSGYDYLSSVVALIYHDLVTAEHITVSRSDAIPSVIQPSATRELAEASWIYIPRKLKVGTADPRTTLPGARAATPHHVSGHKRRGNMSEAHREALKDFERETGLQILQFLPEGYTFVRPHVSPSVQGLSELPRFVHARLQSDIRRLLESRT